MWTSDTTFSSPGSSAPTDLKDPVIDASSSASKEELKPASQSEVKELNENETSHDNAKTEAPAEGTPEAEAPINVPWWSRIRPLSYQANRSAGPSSREKLLWRIEGGGGVSRTGVTDEWWCRVYLTRF